MTDMIIGVDLGGTRIRAALLDSKLNILKRVETLTLADEGLEPTLGRIKEQIHKVLPEDPADKVLGIGVSAPGPLNPITGVVVHPPNLPGWEDVPLANILKDEFNLPTWVGNDANVAVLAETARGAARGYRHAIYITVSTGIGSGMLIDGRLLLGKEGLAAEIGHTILMVEDNVSTLEEEAAGPALAEQAQRHIRAGEASSMVDMVRRGNLDLIDGSVVGRAATTGDPMALRIIERCGKLVGLGIVNMLHLFNPEIVVIGGGVTNVGDLLFKPMRAAIEQYAIDDSYWKGLVITTPDLGEDVSIIGAAVLVVTDGGVEDINNVVEKVGN